MKKNLIILVAVLLTSTFTFAQSGKMFVTGNLGYNSSSSSTETRFNNITTNVDIPASSSFGLGLQGHYMITDNLAVGLGINYNSTKSYSNTISNNKLYNYTSLFEIAPSLIYFIDLSDKFKFAPEFTFGFGFGTNTHDTWDVVGAKIEKEVDDVSYFGLALMPLNFNYNINDNIALSFGFGQIGWSTYTRTNNFNIPNTEQDITNNYFTLSLNNSFRIGLRYFF